MPVIMVILFLLFFNNSYAVDNKKEVLVTGKIYYSNQDKYIGVISFFDVERPPKPDPNYYIRVPDYAFELKEDGKFEGKILEGSYYINVLLNKTGKKVPIEKGDSFYIFKDGEESKIFNIKCDLLCNLGDLEIFPIRFNEFKIKTAIEGVILDENSKPVEGVYVFAMPDNNITQKPLYVSELPSDKNGKFILRLAKGGRYFLKARNQVGSSQIPNTETILGIYGEKDSPRFIDIKDDEIVKNVEIKVLKIKRSSEKVK